MMKDQITAAFEVQINACTLLGSPLTADILRVIADDFAAGGIINDLVGDWQGDPADDNVSLRLAGFVHFKALSGKALSGAAIGVAGLARYFPSCGGAYHADQSGQKHALGVAVVDVFRAHEEAAKYFLRRTPQTNETGRTAILLIGFSEIARRLGLPLRLREMGASAGLNLNFDRFHYAIETDDGPLGWGDPASSLSIAAQWKGRPPQLVDTIEVSDRRGCDLFPVNLHHGEERLALQAWVWGDMAERRARLMAALEIADAVPPVLDKADAVDWVGVQIMQRPAGQTTVLYHSIVWPYLDASQHAAIEAYFAQAGATVTPDAPLVWLRMDHEHIQSFPYLSYQIWDGENGPEGEEVVVGPCHPHGNDIEIEAVF